MIYYIFRAFAWALSRMPFTLIYALSDILYIVLRYLLRYRRSVVRTNLRNAFPEKNNAELRKITSAFYHNLADIMLEVIKLQTISPKELKQRFTFGNYTLLTSSFAKNKSVIIAIGHSGNWEWMGTALGLATRQKGYAIIKPLSSERFHDYMQTLRHRLNPDSTIPFRTAFRMMVRNRNELTFNVIAGDQTPTRDEANYWTMFLNQDTPFFLGIEKIARSLDFTVIFVDIQRTGRGKYHGEMQLITDSPKDTQELEITGKYIHFLEEAIRNDPSNWLWSHRRWKHSRAEEE